MPEGFPFIQVWFGCLYAGNSEHHRENSRYVHIGPAGTSWVVLLHAAKGDGSHYDYDHNMLQKSFKKVLENQIFAHRQSQGAESKNHVWVKMIKRKLHVFIPRAALLKLPTVYFINYNNRHLAHLMWKYNGPEPLGNNHAVAHYTYIT